VPFWREPSARSLPTVQWISSWSPSPFLRSENVGLRSGPTRISKPDRRLSSSAFHPPQNRDAIGSGSCPRNLWARQPLLFIAVTWPRNVHLAKTSGEVRVLYCAVSADLFHRDGVELEVHKLPWLQAANDTVLQPAKLITVAPGIHLPGTCLSPDRRYVVGDRARIWGFDSGRQRADGTELNDWTEVLNRG